MKAEKLIDKVVEGYTPSQALYFSIIEADDKEPEEGQIYTTTQKQLSDDFKMVKIDTVTGTGKNLKVTYRPCDKDGNRVGGGGGSNFWDAFVDRGYKLVK